MSKGVALTITTYTHSQHYCTLLPYVLQLTVLLNITTPTNYHSLELWNTSQNTAQPRIKFVRSLPVPTNYCTQHMHTHSHCVHPAHSVSPRCSARPLPLWRCAPVNLMISHHTTHRSAQTQKACMQRKDCTPTSTLTHPHPHSYTPPLPYSHVAGIPQAPECPEPCCHIHWQLFQQYRIRRHT